MTNDNGNSSTWYLEKVDYQLKWLYDDLAKKDQRLLKKTSKDMGATKYEYLEEILIDYNKAFEMSGAIQGNLSFDITIQDLTKLLLFCGIGVYQRDTLEVAIVSGLKSKLAFQEKERILGMYENNIVEVYDKAMQYLNMSKGQDDYIMSL